MALIIPSIGGTETNEIAREVHFIVSTSPESKLPLGLADLTQGIVPNASLSRLWVDTVEKVSAKEMWNQNLKLTNPAIWIFESKLRVGFRS